MSTPPNSCGHVRAFFAAALVALTSAAAQADQITLQGIPLPGIEVLGVRDGTLAYLAPNGAESATPLADVGKLEIEAHPDYAKAVLLLDAGKPAEAAPVLRDVAQAAGRNEVWVRQFAVWRLAQAFDAAGQGADAVTAFTELVGTQPDPFFLSNPPLNSAAALQGPEAQNAISVLRRAGRGRNVSPEAQAALDAVLERLTPGTAAPGNPNAPAAPDAAADPDAAGLLDTASVAPDDSLVVLPATLHNSQEPAVNHLRAGRFRDALTVLDSQIRNEPGRLQQRLYLRAVALLGLAEDSGQREDFLDAGLGFMRVVAMARTSSAYLGPSLLETAYVHRAIGEPDLAAELFEEAGLLLDEQDEPAYYQRYLDLLTQSP